ncbi:MAG: hypothetical protein LBE25_10205 [Arthrobacter sp.]|nr:hypothetical protein [Arthrobacter sp.]
MSTHTVSATDLARVLAKPTLYRGVAAIVFALVGIFYVQGTPAVALSLSLGIWLLLTALFMWPVARLAGLPSAMRTGVTGSVLAWAVAGVAALLVREPAALAAMGAFGLGLGGLCELIPGIKHRAIGRPLRDMVISGGIGVLGAIVLVWLAVGLGNRIDIHSIFGTLAMIVALLGAHLIIAGLGYRHDARAAEDAA